MSRHPYNPNGSRIQADAPGLYAGRGFIAHLEWDNPAVADPDRILAAKTASGSAATVVTEFLLQPDFPRQISITPGGTTASVAAGNILVEGLDATGDAISENVAIAADATATVLTTRAFASISKITIPKQDGAGATYDVGVTDNLGIPYALAHNTVLAAYLNGVREGTLPTVTVNPDWTKNLVDLSSALNGTKVDVYLIA